MNPVKTWRRIRDAGAWQGLRVCVALMALACVSGALHAQQKLPDLKGIGDPTRPPPGLMVKPGQAGVPAAPSGASGASGVAGSSGEAAAEKPRPVKLALQAIRYDLDTGDAVAMINDELVQVGSKVAGMSVVSISRHGAVLKGPSGTRRLRLLSDEAEEEVDPKPASGTGETAKEGGRKESK